MRRSDAVVLWILATAWLCLEAVLRAINHSVPMPSDAQLDLARQYLLEAAQVIGPDAAYWILVGAMAWMAKGVLGLVILLLCGVELVRWFRRHPPVAIGTDGGPGNGTAPLAQPSAGPRPEVAQVPDALDEPRAAATVPGHLQPRPEARHASPGEGGDRLLLGDRHATPAKTLPPLGGLGRGAETPSLPQAPRRLALVQGEDEAIRFGAHEDHEVKHGLRPRGGGKQPPAPERSVKVLESGGVLAVLQRATTSVSAGNVETAIRYCLHGVAVGGSCLDCAPPVGPKGASQ